MDIFQMTSYSEFQELAQDPINSERYMWKLNPGSLVPYHVSIAPLP